MYCRYKLGGRSALKFTLLLHYIHKKILTCVCLHCIEKISFFLLHTGREQVQAAEQGPNHDLLIMIEDNPVEPPIQVGAVAPQSPPNQPPHGVGNNEIEQNVLNQPPANDPRIPNRVS